MMNVQKLSNGNYLISDDDKSIELSQEDALKLAESIFSTATEDYTTLKKGDPIYYVDDEEHFVEEGVIFGVERSDGKIESFAVDFKDDFDEFNGKALGVCFFRSKELAEHRMNYPPFSADNKNQ